jgi:AmmeMemoRadiSam system protein A
MTSDSDRHRLLEVARDALTAHVTGRTWQAADVAGDLERPASAFVSLHKNGELRGCIGRLAADDALWDVVAACARAAASADPRFAPVTEAELPYIEVEISILGAFEQVRSIDEVEIGRYGLLVEQGRHRGLLLPQVAVEWRWTARMFVEHTCRKAGVPPDAWPHDATLWRFEAEVFSDVRNRGAR